MDFDQFRPNFDPLIPTLKSIPLSAWDDLCAWVPDSERGGIFEIPRAGFVQWRMIIHAQNAFGTNGPTRMMKDSDGLHYLYIQNGDAPIGIEFGKGVDGFRRKKNSNGKNATMLEQARFSFAEDEPVRFNLVYTVDGYGLIARIDRIAITAESAYGVEWRLVIYEASDELGDGFTPPMHPADPNGGPPAPTIVPKASPKDGESTGRTKAAGG